MQVFVAIAPVNLVYIADFRRVHDAAHDDQERHAAVDAGAIAQNVYLCASAGLHTVVRGRLDWKALGSALGLDRQQRIVLAADDRVPKVSLRRPSGHRGKGGLHGVALAGTSVTLTYTSSHPGLRRGSW